MKKISATNKIAVISLNLILFFCPVLNAEVSGKVIGFSCHGCHGTDGQLVKPGMAKLKSQPAEKLTAALLAFKYDKKPAAVMGRIAKGYSDAELNAVARYFSQLK
jgi:sulfide dehydrogenase cytochrome subunit